MENMKKLNKTIFHKNILMSTKLPNPILKTWVLKLVFTTIPRIKFMSVRNITRVDPALLKLQTKNQKIEHHKTTKGAK